MTEFTIQEFLNQLERAAGDADHAEHELLNSEIGLTRPRFTADQLARSGARIAQRVQAQRAKAQSRPPISQPTQPPQAQRSASPPQPAGPKFCTKCGAQRQPEKRFCTQCGTRY